MKRAVVMAESRMIDVTDLELAVGEETMPDLDLRAARLRAEREVLQAALVRSNNTLATAARLLGVSRPTLYGLMEVHGIEVDGMKPAAPADTVAERTETARTA
jgi:two-component system, NtrC family, response regulator